MADGARDIKQHHTLVKIPGVQISRRWMTVEFSFSFFLLPSYLNADSIKLSFREVYTTT